ncbi:MAG: hypothetical protein Q9182_007205 [Xanthomendoza sp. 2 TL-2023]
MAKLESGSKSYPLDLKIASELMDHLAAGHETSGIALPYLMYELSKKPHIQDQLLSELSTLSPSLRHDSSAALSPAQPSNKNMEDHVLPSPRSIDALAFLHAIIMETIRLHAPIPGPQLRITPHTPTPSPTPHPSPPASALALRPTSSTATRASSLHPELEPFPLARRVGSPEDGNGSLILGLGSGGRMCVGGNFAMQEIKLIVADVYSNFRTRIVDDGGIEQIDAYTAGPKGKKLVLALERI